MCLSILNKSYSQTHGFYCDSLNYPPTKPINEIANYYLGFIFSPTYWQKKYISNFNKTLYFSGDSKNNDEHVSYYVSLNCKFSEAESKKYNIKFDTTYKYNENENVPLKELKTIDFLKFNEVISGYLNKTKIDSFNITNFKNININILKINSLYLNKASFFYKKLYDEILNKQALNIELIVIEEPFDRLPDYLSSFKNLKSFELEIMQQDGVEVSSLVYSYATIYLSNLLNNLSDQLRFLKIEKIGGNLFIPESSIQRFKNLEALHLTLDAKTNTPVASIPVSLLLSQKFKFFAASIEYINSKDFHYPYSIYDKDYCNLCYERTCQRLDYANKLDTIIFRDLDQKIYATGKVNDENLAEGKWLFYHKNGTIAEERYYKQGIEVGEWMMYDEEGNRVGHYEFKKDTTICTYYKSTGSLGYQYILFNNYTDGIYKRWNDVGVLVTEKRYKSSRYE